MKKIIKTFLIIYLFFCFIGYVHAETYALNNDEAQNEEKVVPDDALIIGTHLITDSTKASTQLIMDATQTIVGDDAVIFQKLLDKEEADDEENYPEGLWIDAISGDEIVPANVDGLICITHVNGTEVDDQDCDATRFTVKFSGLAGEQTEKTVSIVNGEKIASADIPTPKTKKGYEFVCWVTGEAKNEDHSSCYDFSKTISANVELNPYYDLIKYKIHFDLNGLTQPTTQLSDKTCTIEDLANSEDSNCKLPSLTETRKGYKFDGWSTVKDETGETGTHFEANSSMADMLGDEYNITLYAVWTPQLYTITYNLNGGTYQNQTVVKSSYSVLTRENIELFTPSRTGYTFSGWEVTEHSEDDAVTGPEEADGKYKLTVSEDHLENLTLTAQWKEKEFTITYDLNLEAFPELTDSSTNSRAYATLLSENLTKPENTTCKFETECELAEAPTRDDYIFAGWADSKGYLYTGGNSYTGIDFGDDKAQVELTAQWNAKNEPLYKIEYNLDGGSFAGETVEQYGRKTIDTQLPVPTKIGYKFKGWCSDEQKTDNNCKENAQIKSFLEGEGADPKNLKDLTLYAKWEANTYTVEFYEPIDVSSVQLALLLSGSPDEGFQKITDKDKECTYDTICALDKHSEHFDQKNEILRGWSLNYGAEANNNNVYLSDNITVKNLTSKENGVVKLYAVAEAVEYTITYYLDGGKFAEPSETEPKTKVTKGEKVKIKNPTKEGYTFKGWVDDKGQKVPATDEDDDYAEDSVTITVDKNTVLVATWEKDAEWSLSIYLDGGKFTDEQTDLTTKKHKDGEEIEIPNPTKEGYTFIGWVDQDGKEVPEKKTEPDDGSKTTIEIHKDLFLIAKWKQDNPKITLTEVKSTTSGKQVEKQYKVNIKANNRKGYRTKLKLTITKDNSAASASDIDVSYGSQLETGGKDLQATLKQGVNNGSIILTSTDGSKLEDIEKLLTVTFKENGTYNVKIEIVDYADEKEVLASYSTGVVLASGSTSVQIGGPQQ